MHNAPRSCGVTSSARAECRRSRGAVRPSPRTRVRGARRKRARARWRRCTGRRCPSCCGAPRKRCSPSCRPRCSRTSSATSRRCRRACTTRWCTAASSRRADAARAWVALRGAHSARARQDIDSSLGGAAAAAERAGRTVHVFEALNYLRRLCSHPAMVLSPTHPDYAQLEARCPPLPLARSRAQRSRGAGAGGGARSGRLAAGCPARRRCGA